ncbi:MAG: PEP-CTERM sorting domain-containing protein [Isosphaeraceae bacterium]|nr:PEP-CTERM sorting domain-containing protein [Isosphaeraceae bacterium]
MMKTVNWQAGRRTFALALLLTACLAPGASASALVGYSTSGTIDGTGVTGTPVISFSSTSSGTFNAPSDFSLGDFHVSALADGQATTYTDTPFHITLTVNQVNGAAPEPNQTPVTLSGVLNGTVSGPDQSTVVAKFDPTSTPVFLTGSAANTLSVFDNPLSLVPSTTNGGQTSAQAFLNNEVSAPPPLGGGTEVPEPASVVLFSTVVGGLALRRRVRSENRQHA